jgi:hypothetical protein
MQETQNDMCKNHIKSPVLIATRDGQDPDRAVILQRTVLEKARLPEYKNTEVRSHQRTNAPTRQRKCKRRSALSLCVLLRLYVSASLSLSLSPSLCPSLSRFVCPYFSISLFLHLWLARSLCLSLFLYLSLTCARAHTRSRSRVRKYTHTHAHIYTHLCAYACTNAEIRMIKQTRMLDPTHQAPTHECTRKHTRRSASRHCVSCQSPLPPFRYLSSSSLTTIP